MPSSSVMVVDANPATARRIRQALQGTELDVVTAGGMAQAIERAAESQPLAVFSAVSIPGGNGYELTRKLAGKQPSVAVYLLWGGFEAYDEERAKGAGVRAGLRRPFSRDAVLAMLEEQLGAVPVSSSSLEPVDALEEDLPVGSFEPLDATGPVPTVVEPSHTPPVGNERLATFVPADYDEIPPVRIDREQISVALERAVLAVLPEVLEVVLAKSLDQPGRARAVVDRLVAEAVEAQLPDVVERVVRERSGRGK